MLIRVDCTSLTMVVVGVPVPQVKQGIAQTDRQTGRPLYNLDVTMLSDGRPESVQLSLPEGGFPPNLAVGTVITAEGLVAITWERDGRHGLMWRAAAVKPLAASAPLKAVNS